MLGVWEIVTGWTWGVRMAWPTVHSVAILGSHNCHCLLGWGLGEGAERRELGHLAEEWGQLP